MLYDYWLDERFVGRDIPAISDSTPEQHRVGD